MAFLTFDSYNFNFDSIKERAIGATLVYLSVNSFSKNVKRIFMNKDKGVFGIKMNDGEEIKVHLQKGDTWDTEKALLLCYIKWVNQNKSDFNEIFNLLDRIEDTSKGEKAQG